MTQEIRTRDGRTQVRAARAIGYVRVSRVGGRAGESFIAPDVQREAIASKVAAAGLELVALEEDFDASGRTNERPGFVRALEAVERGEASVIVVARLTRFARSVSGTMRALDRLEAAGGRLIACDVDVDATTPAGRLTRTILASIAEFESELIRENWSTAQAHAIERGVKISNRANIGYRFDEAHRLEVDADAAELVVELFERRAAGASLSELERLTADRGRTIPRYFLRRLLSNRVYLGESSFGELVNLEAHPAIVSPALFDAVQGRQARAELERRRYDPAVRSLLAGIARCATCDHKMRRSPSGQKRIGVYGCRNRECPSKATITEAHLDEFVTAQVLEWAGPVADELVELELGDASGRARLERRLADLELALEAFVTSPDGFGLEPAVFRAGVEARQAAVDEARQELDELADVDDAEAIRTTLREVWPELETAERRRLLAVVIDRVVVRRPARRREPIADRVSITLRDGRAL